MSNPSLRPRRRALLLLASWSAVTAVGLTALPAGPAAAAGPDPRLAGRLDQVMSDSRVKRADSGVVVLDAAGSAVYSRAGSASLMPASTAKVLTAAAALEELGPGYRFRTEVHRRAPVVGGAVQGHLYLKGYGDPTTRVADLRSLAQQVRSSGVRRITGSLVVDATYFDATRYHPAWSTGYADDYYAAETSGLTLAPDADLNSGTVIISFAPGRLGGRAKITTTPAAAAKHLKINNRTTTVSATSTGSATVSRPAGSGTITVSGRVRAGRTARQVLVTVHRPELYAAAVFRAELSRAGVAVAGPTRSGTLPAAGRHRLARDTSVRLADLLVPFLKLSNNAHAEALTKAMGARALAARRARGQGSWPAGVAVTRAYLSRVGVPLRGVSLVDGSGLSRRNRVTARALATALQRFRAEPWFPAFDAALPVAAHPDRMAGGTLRYRMAGTPAARNARAKTGSLTGVTALAGYVRGRDGRRYAFAMVSNYRGATPRPVEDTLVVTLAGWHR